MRKTPPTDLSADWDAIRKKLPKAVRNSEDYPEMMEDWATLKNIPSHAFILEWDWSKRCALHQVKILSKKKQDGWPGFVVILQKTLHKDPDWEPCEFTPTRSKKGQFRERRSLAFTRIEVERLFWKASELHLHSAQRDVQKMRHNIEEMLSQLTYLEGLLRLSKGSYPLHDAIQRLPSKRARR